MEQVKEIFEISKSDFYNLGGDSINVMDAHNQSFDYTHPNHTRVQTSISQLSFDGEKYKFEIIIDYETN